MYTHKANWNMHAEKAAEWGGSLMGNRKVDYKGRWGTWANKSIYWGKWKPGFLLSRKGVPSMGRGNAWMNLGCGRFRTDCCELMVLCVCVWLWIYIFCIYMQDLKYVCVHEYIHIHIYFYISSSVYQEGLEQWHSGAMNIFSTQLLNTNQSQSSLENCLIPGLKQTHTMDLRVEKCPENNGGLSVNREAALRGSQWLNVTIWANMWWQ